MKIYRLYFTVEDFRVGVSPVLYVYGYHVRPVTSGALVYKNHSGKALFYDTILIGIQ